MTEDNILWPENFMDIGGRSFLWVFENRSEWVKFTKNKMTKPTKLFLRWKNYVHAKAKETK